MRAVFTLCVMLAVAMPSVSAAASRQATPQIPREQKAGKEKRKKVLYEGNWVTPEVKKRELQKRKDAKKAERRKKEEKANYDHWSYLKNPAYTPNGDPNFGRDDVRDIKDDLGFFGRSSHPRRR